MSSAGGEGAAYDATAKVDEGPPPEVVAWLAAQEGRALVRYAEQVQIEGTREHAAHVAQLRRLVDEAEAAVTSAATAHARAQAAEDGAYREHTEAKDRLAAARAALAEFTGEVSDGVE